MKRFASHRLYIPHKDLLLANHVVEVDDAGRVLSYYPFVEEISFTEWLGGLIILSSVQPAIGYGSNCNLPGIYIDKDKKIRSVSYTITCDTPLYAYHVSAFNVADMCFSDKSRAIKLF